MTSQTRPSARREAEPVDIVFLDIDGTLVLNRRLIPSAVTAVKELQARGIEAALCTGRSVLHARRVQQRLNVPHAVYFNGGLVISHDQVIARSPLHPSVVVRMLDFFPAEGLPLILHTLDRAVSPAPLPPAVAPILEVYDYPPVDLVPPGDIAEIAREDVYQANVFMGTTWDQRIQNTFPECLLYRWDPAAVDLQKRGCDKSHGAEVLLTHLGISPSRAMHIGDGGNDIGMFQMMGWSVAMGNAAAEIQRHAKIVTSPAEEDGVYRALRNLGLI